MELNTRQTMSILPGWCQPFLTWLTGKALSGQSGRAHSPYYHLIVPAAYLMAGVTVSAVLASRGLGMHLALLPLSWLATVSGARKLQLMIVHQCAHRNFSGNPRIDEFVGTAISLLLTIEPFKHYRAGHIELHHSQHHMSRRDPTVVFLFERVGVRPGMTMRELWRRLLMTLVSPQYHLAVTVARLKSLGRGSAFELAAYALFWSSVLAIVVAFNAELIFAVAWLVPIVLLYNVSSCLRLSSEHRWPDPATEGERLSRKLYASYSTGIFLGEAAPSPALRSPAAAVAWTRWTLRMLFIHLPSRLFVLVGDTPCHDFHHRYPKAQGWMNYAYERQRDLDAGAPGWPPYTEIWGLVPAINAALISLSRTYHAPYTAEPAPTQNSKEVTYA